MQLKGKLALITGGSKGIGFSIANLFAAEGAKVIIVGRDKSLLEEAAKFIKGDLISFVCDVSKPSELEKLFKKVYALYGKLDVICANAGSSRKSQLTKSSEELFDKVVSVNYKGLFFTIQKSVDYLNNNASIVLMGSMAASLGYQQQSIYASSKAAVVQLARNFAAELVQKGVRVNAISPGYIKTAIWEELEKQASDIYKSILNDIPLQHRFGRPDEVAKVALFLASEASSYITGQNLIVDGGLSTIV